MPEPLDTDAVTAASATPDMADVGILCIHGMGQQKRGDALSTPLRAVKQWLEQCFAFREGGGAVSILDANLAAAQLSGGEPANARLRVPDGDESREWLFAESWWAEDFEPPGIPSLCWWMLVRGSAVVSAHLFSKVLDEIPPARLDRFGRDIGEFGKGLVHFGGERNPDLSAPFTWRTVWRGWMALMFLVQFSPVVFLAVILPTFVLQLFTAVVMVLALIPVSVIRNRIRGLLTVMRSVLGDGYQFTENAAVRSAILTHVKKDLDWLASRVGRVVVLAHSQGAAVAYRALMSLSPEERPACGVSLLTYGSGLVKLERLGSVKPLVPMLIALGTPVYLVSMLPLLRSGSLLTSLVLLLAPMAMLLCLLLLQVGRSQELGRQLYADFLAAGVGEDWLDIRGSRDPVPTPIRNLRNSVSIENYRSVLLDHTSYWANADAFIPLVLNVLLGDGSELGKRLSAGRNRWKAGRDRRLFQLCLGRLCVLGALTYAVLYHYESAYSLHHWGSERLEMLLPGLIDWYPPYLTAVLVFAGLGAGWYAVTLGAWLIWNRGQSVRARGAQTGDPARGGWIWSLPFLSTLAAPLPWVFLGPDAGSMILGWLSGRLPQLFTLLHGLGWLLLALVLVLLVLVPVVAALRRDRR